MIHTDFAKRVLKGRRETRDMTKAGWLKISEGGHLLNELARGNRTFQRIVEAKPAHDGKSVWVRLE